MLDHIKLPSARLLTHPNHFSINESPLPIREWVEPLPSGVTGSPVTLPPRKTTKFQEILSNSPPRSSNNYVDKVNDLRSGEVGPVVWWYKLWAR